MTAPELKPCPFCGGNASYNVTSDEGQQNDYDTVGCSACPAEMRIILHWADDDGKNKADLLSAWNRRADLSAVQPAQAGQTDEARPTAIEKMAYTAGYIDGNCGCKHRFTGQIGVAIGNEYGPALEPQPDPRDTALEIWKLANSRDPDDPMFIAAILALIGKANSMIGEKK